MELKDHQYILPGDRGTIAYHTITTDEKELADILSGEQIDVLIRSIEGEIKLRTVLVVMQEKDIIECVENDETSPEITERNITDLNGVIAQYERTKELLTDAKELQATDL